MEQASPHGRGYFLDAAVEQTIRAPIGGPYQACSLLRLRRQQARMGIRHKAVTTVTSGKHPRYTQSPLDCKHQKVASTLTTFTSTHTHCDEGAARESNTEFPSSRWCLSRGSCASRSQSLTCLCLQPHVRWISPHISDFPLCSSLPTGTRAIS